MIAAATTKPRPNRISNPIKQNGDYPVEYPVDYNLVKNPAQRILLPFNLRTYYYNCVPSYANMDTPSLKEAIRKQM